MNILVIGSGGREHAIAHALSVSRTAPRLFIAPGNAGTRSLGTNVDLHVSDLEGITSFVRRERIDLTVIGPEEPLVLGLADRLAGEGFRVVGPSAAAARLEGSKAFAKGFMERYGIPTAPHRTFTADRYEEAVAYLEGHGAPIVVKADGLAAGKGAMVCRTLPEAREALDEVLKHQSFGQAGRTVVIESFMEGEEATVFALADGRRYVLLPAAQDHKRAGDGDAGPNTGGMGAYAPAPVVTGALLNRVARTIIEPVLAGMAHEGTPYRGFLYCGLMIGAEGPRVVEFNCRLGDPEAQAVLPLIETDFVDLMAAAADGRLDDVQVRAREGSAACVVLASGGYPGPYEKGFPIRGLEEAAGEAVVYHAGTRPGEGGEVLTAGGRVLGVTGLGEDLRSALDRAYRAVEAISFEGMQYRRDIGSKGLARLSATD